MLWSNRSVPVLLTLALALAQALASPVASTASAASADQRESWYVVRFSGSPVGVGKDHWSSDGDLTYYENHIEIEASRLGTPIHMVMRLEEWADDSGRPLRFRGETIVTGTVMAVSGELVGDTLRVRSGGQGFEHAQRIPWEPEAIGQATINTAIAAHLSRGEKNFHLRVFDAPLLAFRTSEYRVGERVTATIAGERAEYTMVEQYDDGAGVPSATYWIDGNFEPKKMLVQQMGIEIVIEEISAQEAAVLDLDPNFDVIRGSMIPCGGYPDDADRVESATFRLTFSRPVADASVFASPSQKVVATDGATVDLLVTRRTLETPQPTPSELAAYLRPDRYIQSAHPAIQAIADSLRASGSSGEAETLALARRIAAWVNDHIEAKNFSQGFASAVDALAAREGDCTEHAVLTAALLRASGIPARVAAGLAYSNGSLVGHMWTEAYVGRWITLDALDLDTRPIRIRMSVSHNERALAETDIVNAYSLVGGLWAEVIDYEARGRP